MSVNGEIKYTFVASGQDSVLGAFRSIDNAAKSSARVTEATAEQATRATRASTAARLSAEDRYHEARYKAHRREVQEGIKGYKKLVEAEREAVKERVRLEVQRRQAVYDSARRARAAYDMEQQAAEAAAKRKQQLAADARRQSVGTSFGAVLGLASRGLTAALGGASLAAGAVGAAAREQVELTDFARRLAISGRAPGDKGADPHLLVREFENTALATPGVAAMDVAEGTQTFVTKTGDLGMARGMQGTFATTASATGSQYADIASTGADLMQKFDIKGVHEMQAAFATLNFQGKKGAFELKDAARYFSEMASAADRFGVGKGSKALSTLGGLAQIARTATGTGAEAATSVQSMFGQLTAKAGQIRSKYGVHVFDESGKSRDIKDVLVETIGKVGGADLEKKKSALQGIFGEQGIRAVSPLISAFSKAAMGTQGDDAQKVAEGMRAVRAALNDAIDAPGTWADVVDDAALAQESSSIKLSQAWEKLKAKTLDEVVPALIKLVPKLAGFVDAIDPIVKGMGTFLDVMNEVVDFMKEKGLIQGKDKPKTVAQTERELNDFNDVLAAKGLDITPEDIAKRNTLEQSYREAYGREYQPIRKSITEDEFVSEFVGASGRTDEEDVLGERTRAKAVYQGLLADPRAELTLHDNSLAKLFGSDTDEQRSLITETAGMFEHNKYKYAGKGEAGVVPAEGGDVSQFTQSLATATAAAEKFAASIDKAEPKPLITGNYSP